jgi:hypothetical protein
MMFKEVAKQMIPFFILLGVLWVTAEILERSLGPGHTIIAPPGYEPPARPAPADGGR